MIVKMMIRSCVLCGFMLLIMAACILQAAAAVSLNLTSEARVYLPEERCYLVASLENDGWSAADIVCLIDPSYDLLTLEIVDPAGQRHIMEPRGHGDMSWEGIENSIIRLAPGERYRETLNITYEMMFDTEQTESRVASVLSTPGEYQMRACYSVPADWPTGPLLLWSNMVAITVAVPTGDDLGAIELLHTSPSTYEQGIWNSASEQAAYYKAVIERYPGSRYALQARLSLGHLRHFDGVVRLRGTPAGEEALEESRELLLSVAAEEKNSLLGLTALKAAARCAGNLGDNEDAITLLQQLFLSPVASDSDRATALSFMSHIENGVFRQDAGYEQATSYSAQLSLRQCAEKLGYTVYWNTTGREAALFRIGTYATLKSGVGIIQINGVPRSGVRNEVHNSRILVSPSVIATLMAEKYGPGMAHAFPANMIAKAPETAAPR